MNREIVLTLPEETYDRAANLANLTNRGLADVLNDALSLSLPSLAHVDPASAVSSLSDSDILQLAEAKMAKGENQRLSQLLYQQQANQLHESELTELTRLMQVYQVGLLRKAMALAEAVQRGLHPPLTS